MQTKLTTRNIGDTILSIVKNKIALFALCLFFSCSCVSVQTGPNKAIVDLSAKKIYVKNKSFNVKTSRYGVGGKPRSYKTPVGVFRIISKEPYHRYGEILRLGGKSSDGYSQEQRGILIHKMYSPVGSHGCVTLSKSDMGEVFDLLHQNDIVEIRR